MNTKSIFKNLVIFSIALLCAHQSFCADDGPTSGAAASTKTDKQSQQREEKVKVAKKKKERKSIQLLGQDITPMLDEIDEMLEALPDKVDSVLARRIEDTLTKLTAFQEGMQKSLDGCVSDSLQQGALKATLETMTKDVNTMVQGAIKQLEAAMAQGQPTDRLLTGKINELNAKIEQQLEGLNKRLMPFIENLRRATAEAGKETIDHAYAKGKLILARVAVAAVSAAACIFGFKNVSGEKPTNNGWGLIGLGCTGIAGLLAEARCTDKPAAKPAAPGLQ